jgi:hypothetical protein
LQGRAGEGSLLTPHLAVHVFNRKSLPPHLKDSLRSPTSPCEQGEGYKRCGIDFFELSAFACRRRGFVASTNTKQNSATSASSPQDAKPPPLLAGEGWGGVALTPYLAVHFFNRKAYPLT